MSVLRTRPVATPAMIDVFADTAVIEHVSRFETALARAEAAEGLISPAAADVIAVSCHGIVIDPAELAEEAALAGTLAIPLLARLRITMDPEAAEALHRGATSQDVADTVLMLQLKTATALLLSDVTLLTTALARHARRLAATPSIGRTLLQDARPIGFGLRIAQWHTGISSAAARLHRESSGASVQFGGPVGTHAGLDGKGAAISARLAASLGLAAAPPWHARREHIAAIGAAVGILIGASAKMARDVSLLAQNAIGEAHEPAVAGRGGSSVMAHKRNPTGCQVALSAAIRAPGLVAGLLSALPADLERGLGGWQAEGPMLIDLFLLASGAIEAMATVSEGLDVDTAAIARNLAAAGQGDDIGESVAIVEALLEREP